MAGGIDQRLVFLTPAGTSISALARLIGDQLVDYARRENLSIAEAEKNLASNLGYLPPDHDARQVA